MWANFFIDKWRQSLYKVNLREDCEFEYDNVIIPLFPPTGDGVVTGGGGGVKLSTTNLYCILNPLEPEMSLVLYEIKKTCSRTPMNPIEAVLQSVTKGFPSEKQLSNKDRQYNVLHILIKRNMTKPIKWLCIQRTRRSACTSAQSD